VRNGIRGDRSFGTLGKRGRCRHTEHIISMRPPRKRGRPEFFCLVPPAPFAPFAPARAS
jgi:hypothetical protein